MFKVVRTFKFQEGVVVEQEILKDAAEVRDAECLTEEDILRQCGDADAIICAYEPFTARVLRELPNLKHLAFKTIGYNYADVACARELGIAVSHISRYCVNEVADYATGLILTLNRRIAQFNDDVHQNKAWNFMLCPEMRRFRETTVGLIGFGNIPRLIARRLKPFGVRVIASDPYVDPRLAASLDVELKSFNEVFAEADYLSIHLPLSPATEKFMGREQFARMKDGAVFINSARGGLVDEEALIEALDSGKLRFAAMDVVEDVYPDMETHPFASRSDILLTPHIAWFSEESVREGRIEAAQNVLNFFRGEYDKCQIINGVAAAR